MAETLSELVIKILGDTQNFNAEIKKAKKVTEESFGEIKNIISNTGLAMSGAGIAMGFLGKGFIDAASKAEQYKVTLFAVTKSQAETNKLMKDAYDYAKTTPFEVGEIVKATVLLKAMGLEVEKTRHLAANLASAFSKDGKADLGGAINAIAKAMSGSAEGFEILRNQYGITTQELAKFGAATKDGTQMIYAQKGAIEQNAAALTKLINTKYGTAIELQSNTAQTAMSNFSDAIDRLKVAIGTEMLPTITDWAKKLTGLVEGLEKMDPAVKNATAKILLFTPPLMIGSGLLASFVANVLQATTAINALSVAYGGLSNALRVFATSATASALAFTGAVAVIVAGTLTIADAYQKMLDAENEAKEATRQEQANELDGLLAIHKFQKGQKLNSAEISKAISFQKNQITALNDETRTSFGNEQARKAEIWKATKLYEKLRVEQEKITKEVEKEVEARRRSEPRSTIDIFSEGIARKDQSVITQVKDLKEKNDLELLSVAQKRQYISLLRQEADIISKQAKSESDPEKREKLETQAHQKRVTAHNEEKQMDADLTKQKEDNRQRILKGALDYLSFQKNMNNVSEQEEVAYLRRILDNYKLTAEEKRQIQTQIFQVESQTRQKAYQEEKAILDDQRSAREITTEQYIRKLEQLKNQEFAVGATRKQIERDIQQANRQLNREKVQDAKKTAEEIAQAEEKRKQATETVQDEINRVIMSKQDYEINQIQKKIEEFRAAGVEELKIKEWVKAQEQRLVKEAQESETKAIDKTSDKLDELKRKFDSIQRPGGANSPLMTLEQVGLSSAMMFAGGTSAGQAAAGTSDKPNISLSSLLSQGGASSAAAMGMKAGAGSFNNNYTVQIGNIEVTGEQARQVY